MSNSAVFAQENNGDFDMAITTLTDGIPESKIESCLAPFERELEVAKKSKLQAVNFSLMLPDNKHHTLDMPIKSFFQYIDTALLKRYARVAMPDFPCRRYFGEQGEFIFDKLLKKRFLADFKKNFEAFNGSKDDNYSIEINRVTKMPYVENSYDGIKTRHLIKEYIHAAYEEPEIPLKNIAEHYKKNEAIIDDVRKMIKK